MGCSRLSNVHARQRDTFSTYGQPNVERKNNRRTASRRKFAQQPSTGSHPRRGGVPDAPETSSSPIPRKPPGPGMPYRAAVGKPPAVQTPAEGSKTPPQYEPINECPPLPRLREGTSVGRGAHTAASSRGSPSTGDHPRGAASPTRNLLPSPPTRVTPGPGMPLRRRRANPLPSKRPRRGQDPSLRTDPSTSACPPPRGGAGTATKNRGDPFSRDCLGSLYKHYKRLIVPDGFSALILTALFAGRIPAYQPHQRGEYQRRQHEPGRDDRNGRAAAPSM